MPKHEEETCVLLYFLMEVLWHHHKQKECQWVADLSIWDGSDLFHLQTMISDSDPCLTDAAFQQSLSVCLWRLLKHHLRKDTDRDQSWSGVVRKLWLEKPPNYLKWMDLVCDAKLPTFDACIKFCTHDKAFLDYIELRVEFAVSSQVMAWLLLEKHTFLIEYVMSKSRYTIEDWQHVMVGLLFPSICTDEMVQRTSAQLIFNWLNLHPEQYSTNDILRWVTHVIFYSCIRAREILFVWVLDCIPQPSFAVLYDWASLVILTTVYVRKCNEVLLCRFIDRFAFEFATRLSIMYDTVLPIQSNRQDSIDPVSRRSHFLTDFLPQIDQKLIDAPLAYLKNKKLSQYSTDDSCLVMATLLRCGVKFHWFQDNPAMFTVAKSCYLDQIANWSLMLQPQDKVPSCLWTTKFKQMAKKKSHMMCD
jgi:hypothetical protein